MNTGRYDALLWVCLCVSTKFLGLENGWFHQEMAYGESNGMVTRSVTSCDLDLQRQGRDPNMCGALPSSPNSSVLLFPSREAPP